VPRLPNHTAKIIAVLACSCLTGPLGTSTALASRSARRRPASAHRSGRERSIAACAAERARTRARAACRHTRPTARHHATAPSTPPPAAVPATAPSRPPAPSPAAVIASALAAPCPNSELVPEAGNVDAVRTAVLCLINRERAQHGETPLSISADLERAAEEHDQELVAEDYFAHVSPSGLTPVQRISATGYIPGPEAGYVLGENLAWGTLGLSTPAAIVAAWIASPGHLANILEGQYTETGIGVVPAVPASLGQGEQGGTYAQEFGVIIR